ncbi:MAG: glycosyltransferase family 4 protein [Aquaticitalea sp.]
MKTRILIITSEFPPQPGGIGNHAYHLAFYLTKRDYKVSVIADQRSLESDNEVVFDAALPFTVHRIRLRKVRLMMYLQRFRKTIKLLKNADVVIATGKFPLWNVAFCTQMYHCPSLAIIHGSEVNFKSFGSRTMVNVSLRKFDTIIAVSNYTKQLISHLNLEVEVIPNGIEISQWTVHKEDEFSLEGYPILTTVGRVSTRKGQLNVIKSLPELLKIFPKIHYHCVGIPTEREAFLAEAKNLQVDKHLTFHGVLDHNALKSVLIETDVFVMMSQETTTGDVEGFGIAILEANAMGVPSLGSMGCGIEDAIKPGETGFLIEPNNAKALQKSLIEIVKNKESFKEQSIVWAKTHDWAYLIERYIALLP